MGRKALLGEFLMGEVLSVTAPLWHVAEIPVLFLVWIPCRHSMLDIPQDEARVLVSVEMLEDT